MTGHTTCHGVDCIFNGCAVCTEFISDLFDKMLCLGDCHTIARNDDDFFCANKCCCVICFNCNLCRGGNFVSNFYFNRLVHICDEGLQ